MSLVVTDTNWAVHEFADADLGDERRTTRLVELAYALGQHPTAAHAGPPARVRPPPATLLPLVPTLVAAGPQEGGA